MSVSPATVHAPPGVTTLRSSRGRTTEIVVKIALGLCAAISIATTIGIVFSLLLPALDFFREINPVDFLTGRDWSPLFEPASFGVVPLITATFTITFWAMLIAIPFGLGTAIFLAEYASERTRNTLKPMIEILAGVPTVVFGYFALTAVTPLLRSIGIEVEIFNVLSGGLVIGVMLIPTIASLSEDAMSAVPQALRDGSYGLGADRLQTSLRVVVPAATSGIIASFVLGISRAVGETMIVLIAVGQLARVTADPRLGAESLTAFIGATGNGDLPTGSIEYKTIFAVGLTLFVITFVMNMIAIRLVRKFREVYD
ncbi:MAG: phosphate ABC transporter permease subunit PstC [Gaiella sp.]